MHIKVTCAASSANLLKNESNMVKIDKSSSVEIIHKAFTTAAEQSLNNGQPVYVDFR